MKRIASILFLLAGVIPAVHAQTMPEVEQQIKLYLDGISYWRFEYSEEDTSFGHKVKPEDSLNTINEQLFNYIKDVVVHVPGVLKHPPGLPENSDLEIVTSHDKKFSIYSWDTHNGGTWHFYNSIALFDAGNGRVVADTINYVDNNQQPPASGGAYQEVLTVSAKEKTYYLAICMKTFSNSDKAKEITAFETQPDRIEMVGFFEKDGQINNSILFEYDYMSNYDFEKMKEINTIHLSKNGKKLYIPEVVDQQMTGEWEIYDLDGSKFVYDKKGK